MILGIETVTRVGSLALVEEGTVLASSVIDTELDHAAGLVSILDRLLKSQGLDVSKVDTIAVDVGPGSFTGIRVGIASAKGLVQLDNKCLVGVCSLEVLSLQRFKEGMPEDLKYLVPFIDAKRGGIYSAWYIIKGGRLQLKRSPYLTTLERLLTKVPANSYIFGPDITRFKERVSRSEKTFMDVNDTFPNADMVACVAGEKIKEGLKDKSVEPMYIYDVEYR